MDFMFHLLSATLFGSLIGLERQWHQGFAGLRTNALVAAGAAAFAGAALSTVAGGNPSAMLGQIITGIGFLGAGVIFKEGLNVRGLNTAATIWCSAAVGLLCGIGMLPHAALTAAVVVVVNVAMRPLVRFLGEMPESSRSEQPTLFAIHFSGPKKSELRLRTQISIAASLSRLTLRKLRSEEAGAGRIQVHAELALFGRQDHRIEDLAERLGQDPEVKALRWEIVKTVQQFE